MIQSTPMFPRGLQRLISACLLSISSQLYADFSDPNFIEETIYEGNGMISMAFDDDGRLYVTEKQGRLLVFEPNDLPQTIVSYQYYEGTWTELPDFDSLTPVATGTTSEFSLDPKLRNDNFAFRYTTTITAPTSDTYTFYTSSDDGSRLLVNGAEIVDNDGLHGTVEASGTVQLTEGEHTVVVEFFENGGGESLQVQWESSTLPKQNLGGASGDFLPPIVVSDLTAEVNADGERGLLGLALDPDFSQNRYVYLFYSTNTDQRLVRLTLETDFKSVQAGSQTILLSGLPNNNPVHNSGDIHFAPDDPFTIFIMQGDDGDRYIVEDLNNYNGKILRVDAATGQGLSDNPFWDGNPDSVRSRIWAHSFRNAFRFAFDPAYPIADVLYISENGDGTDRLARIEKGANGAWPDSDYLQSAADGSRTILRTTDPSVTAVQIIRGGPFAPDGPVIYQARYGGNDRKEIRRWNLVGTELDQISSIPIDDNGPFLDNFTGFNIVSFTMGPDGALYFTDSNQGDSTGTGYHLGRIRYQGGEPPVAAFSINGANRGDAPFLVEFNDASSSADAPLATWLWDFGDGQSSTHPNPNHTYTEPGVYTVRLTVTNTDGLLDTETAQIAAYMSLPIDIDATLQDARGALGNINNPVNLKLYQADGTTPAQTSTGSGDDLNTFSIAANSNVDLSTIVQLTHPGIVLEINDPSELNLVSAKQGFYIDLDGGSQLIETAFYLSDTAIHGQVLDTLDQAAATDIGLQRAGTPYAIPGGRDYPSGNHTPPTGIFHRLDLDALGYYYFPIQTADADAEFTIETTGDSNRLTYGSVSETEFMNAGEEASIQLILGLYDGGIEPDDLSGITETANIDFDTQIQPILTSACVACHNDIATNSGGLDLQPGASFAELVNQYSTEARGIKLVDPGAPERSYLMEKINSTTPQIGTRMRPNDPMPLANQALIRDWINQLTPYAAWRAHVFEGTENTAADADYDGDSVSNLAEFTFGTDPTRGDALASRTFIQSNESGALGITLPALHSSINVIWQSSLDLSPNSWTSIATRNAHENWTLANGYTMTTDPESGEIQLMLPPTQTDNTNARFFRLYMSED